MDNAKLRAIVEHISGLQSLPEAIHRVMVLVNDEESTVPEMVEALLMDQGLTAKVLTVANSAYYGFVRRVDTVTQAVALLGKNDIADHVVAAALHNYFATQGPGIFDRRAFWEHCFAVGQCTKVLLRLSPHPAEKVFIAALLRDMGQLVIDDVFPREHDRIISLAQENQWPIQRAEREVLGFDHCLLGGMMAQRWDFPQDLVDFISNHHQRTDDLPPDTMMGQMRTLIDLADRIVRGEGVGQSYDFSSTEISEEMWFPLGLNAAHHDRVVMSLQLGLNNIGAAISA